MNEPEATRRVGMAADHRGYDLKNYLADQLRKAAFAVLERGRSFMQENAQPFEVALAATRSENLFTTHTAVGFDRFTPAIIAHYLGGYLEKLGISLHELLPLGRENSNDGRKVSQHCGRERKGSEAFFHHRHHLVHRFLDFVDLGLTSLMRSCSALDSFSFRLACSRG
jgi:hypothetical protein